MTSPAALVRSYREQIALDPEMYDGDYDVVRWLLEDTVGRDWTPSQVARVLGVPTWRVGGMLGELAERGFIARTQRGAWSRYWGR